MKTSNKIILLFIGSFLFISHTLPAQWSPAGNTLKTAWADIIKTDDVMREYPRPIMERSNWMNLNGLWNYTISPVARAAAPTSFDGKILVPFAAESSLSGVGKRVGSENHLWMQRSFSVPKGWNGKRLLLHFGAVDWKTTVWVNGIQVGEHTGGYTEFTFDITDALRKGENELLVRVWDPTDESYQPRGKQVNRPGGIWYMPVTGIWQTVWLEPVSPTYIRRLMITPDIDRNVLTVRPLCEGNPARIAVTVFEGKQKVAQATALGEQAVEISMPRECKLWSPDTPFLYDLQVNLTDEKGITVDCVKSYAAMRKFSRHRDAGGHWRIQLNNEDIFPFGPLDQGWWPDGLYTAPTDEALLFDLQKTIDFGYNMVRKHIKVEPARWYTYCDRMGLMVWQDMPSGDGFPGWNNTQWFTQKESERTPQSEACYRKEWQEIMEQLYSYPCISVWVPFNEAWGEFKTEEIARWTQQSDPTRLVNPASGGNHFRCGDILDLHNYPHPSMYLTDSTRVMVLGEYGGIGLPVEGHLWSPEHNWGYIQYHTSEEVTDRYEVYARQLIELIKEGVSAAVYTQTTDVEIEVNGLMTYDRQIIKVDEKRLRRINREVIRSLSK